MSRPNGCVAFASVCGLCSACRERTERETAARIVAWLRRGGEYVVENAYATRIANAIERGDWRDDAKGGG